MSRYSDSDPYIDPTTGVLKNRLGIADESTLARNEAALVATRSLEFSEAPLTGKFDLLHLQEIHTVSHGKMSVRRECWKRQLNRSAEILSKLTELIRANLYARKST